ncbi:MAG: WbqC family protein, partial [Marinilabiliaceae bacterium]
NLESMNILCELAGIDAEISFTGEFVKNPPHGILDMRDNIHPKKSYQQHDPFFTPHPYKQVFDDRHGFVPNLSILDLLFNKGPETRLVLEQSMRNKA